MKADTITKDYVRNADIFADIFNYYIYGGQQVILPERLLEQDSTKTALPYGIDGVVMPVQKFRDVQKLYSVMTDGEVEYVLYGVENQSEIHYAMPVKSNLYDALDYAGQVEKTAKTHRRKMKERQLSDGSESDGSGKVPGRGEFLSGFWKQDKLIPSVTLTIHFGADEWDGPLSLFEMMRTTDPKVLACMDDYHVRLIAPAQMADEEIMKFRSSLREVMFFIKYSKEKNALNDIIQKNKSRYANLERRAADVIKIVTNLKINFSESEGPIDMCKAVQDMCDESRAKGRAEGRAEGTVQKAQEAAKNFYAMGLTVNQIAQGVNYDVETVKQWLEIF